MELKNVISGISSFFGKQPLGTGEAEGISKDADVHKAVIPKFLYKPPFGYPRFVDVPELRRLAKTPFVEMCISTIIDEIAAVEWEIVPRDEENQDTEGDQDSHIKEVRRFFEDPNVNKENFEQQLRKIVRDVLTIDSGVWVKVFDRKGDFKQLYVRDGGTFTKNPDRFGTFENRKEIVSTIGLDLTEMDQDTYNNIITDEGTGKEKPAYFQYGWITGARPMPFGTREIVYIMRNPQPDSIYGQSPVEILLDVIQMLVYGVEHNLEYYTDNNIPKGVLQMVGANQEDIDKFRNKFGDKQKKKDEVGNVRKRWWNMPIVGNEAEFKRVQFSNAELELISQQEWFTKLVWACFGVTPSELGFTQDSNRATEIAQSRVFQRKAIRPILKTLQYHINSEIVWREFYDDVRFQFNMYNLREDLEKHDLYEKQVNTYKTPNEIREQEGLKPIEGGDKLLAGEENSMLGKKDIQRITDGIDSKSVKKKQMTAEDNPLILEEFEKPADPQDLQDALDYLLERNKEKILEILDRYGKGEEELQKVKSKEELKQLNPKIVDKIKGAFSLSASEEIAKDVIKNSFVNSLQDVAENVDSEVRPDQAAIDFLQEHSFEDIKDLEEETANDLRGELERGLLNGEGTDEIKDRVKEIIDDKKGRAKAIAQTEVNRATNVGHVEGYKEAGISGKKRWDAEMDERTTERCKRLDGQEVDLDDNFSDPGSDWEGPHPPAHINCRSRVTVVPEE